MPPRRNFKRPLGKRRYRKLFILAVEGARTEPQYFERFNNKYSTIHIRCIKGKNYSSPNQVLKRIKEDIRRNGLRKDDEAWIVVDKDQWTEDQLSQLHNWTTRKKNYGLALSNPKFEYWLLLHFEEGNDISSSQVCLQKLKKHLPLYDKQLNKYKFTRAQIQKAISRAKQRDNPPCVDWPRTTGTTVYKLVSNILKTPDRY